MRGEAAPAAPRSRVVLYGALAAVLLAGGAAIAWKQWWSARPGRIEISTTPSGATVTLAGDPEAHRAPVAFEKPPGHYTISVARDGFQRDDRAVDLHAGQEVVLSVALAPVAPPQPPAIVPEPIGGARPAPGARRAAAGTRAPAGRMSMSPRWRTWMRCSRRAPTRARWRWPAPRKTTRPTRR